MIIIFRDYMGTFEMDASAVTLKSLDAFQRKNGYPLEIVGYRRK